MTSRNINFYVVQFINLPFESIDDNICVPRSWLVLRMNNQNAVVAYPGAEDPVFTRYRVRRQEERDRAWKVFSTNIKYEADTYQDALNWIATRNYHEPLIPIRETDAQQGLTSTIKASQDVIQSNPVTLLSYKRPAFLESKKQPNAKRLNIQSSNAHLNGVSAKPGCSKWNQPSIIHDKEPVECAQGETAAVSSGDSNPFLRTNENIQKSSHTQKLNMPLIDVCTPTPTIIIGKKVHPNNREQQLSSNEVFKKPANQPKSGQNSQISVAPSINMTLDDQHPRSDTFLNNETTSRQLLGPLKMSDNQCDHGNKTSHLVPIQTLTKPITTGNPTGSVKSCSVDIISSIATHHQSQDSSRGPVTRPEKIRDQAEAQPKRTTNSPQGNYHVPETNDADVASVDPRKHLKSFTNVASASSNPSSFTLQSPSYDHQSNGQQNVLGKKHFFKRECIRKPADNDTITNNNKIQKSKNNNHDHQQGVKKQTPPIRQNTSHSSNRVHEERRQSSPDARLVQRRNNGDCAGTASGNSSADRPTVVQNHQMHSADFSQHQILENVANLFSQTAETLRYIVNLRSPQ